MIPAYLLDADCCIYALDGERYPMLRTRLAASRAGSVGISAITLSEVMLGSVNGLPPALHQLRHFLLQIAVIPFDRAAAQTYATLPFRRARFDRLVAAHALSIGAGIVTNNIADFADVPGLRVENWTLPA